MRDAARNVLVVALSVAVIVAVVAGASALLEACLA